MQNPVPEPPLGNDTAAFRAWAVAMWIVAVVWLVWLAVPTLADVVQVVDDHAANLVVDAERPALVAASTLLDIVGSTVAMTIFVIAMAGLLALRGRWPGLAVWLIVAFLSQALNALIKELYQRPRPTSSLVEEGTSSFVSGHSLIAAALAITLVLIWMPAGARRRNLLIAATVWAVVMAASRVYLRAHWFSDAFAGLVIGTAISVTVVVMASWWSARPQS